MSNLIDRQAAIDALAEDMPQTYTPDGSHPADEGIFMAQEIYADCIQTLRELPPAQPAPSQVAADIARIVENVKDMRVIAQPERIRGRWIYHPEWANDGECGYECSVCHMGSDIDYNFCMRCGADMRGTNK